MNTKLLKIIYHHRTQGEEPESIHISEIIAALQAAGHEVSVIAPSTVGTRAANSGRTSVLSGIKRRVPRPVFEVLQITYNIVVFTKLVLRIRTVRPDFIYERYSAFTFAGVLVSRLFHIPIILEVNTPYAQAWAKYYGLYFEKIARWLERETFRAATHLITVTEAQRRLLIEEGVPEMGITVCHNAINPQFFNPALYDSEAIRQRLGVRGTVIGFVGTMNRWQGMQEFPDMIREVLARNPSACFLLVGDGEFRNQLESSCSEASLLGRVLFTGRRTHDEIPELIAAMDIAVLLNSNTYGSPMKIFEYWGMQKAVIVPAVPPVLEIVQDGVTGLIIPPGDTKAMANCISRLCAAPELQKQLGIAGRARALANHTWSRNVDSTIGAYFKIAGSGKYTSSSQK